MAQIDMSSGSASAYGAGELQLQGKVQMTATLTPVTDNLNVASPLLLSTSLVQSTSTVKITTADNPYIDAEDNSGNNRFTIGRDPASQQVNLDFASNPTGSTTYVGAIRTYTDGVNLGEVVSFREDGFTFFKAQTYYYAVKNADGGSDYFWNDINPNITAGANNQLVSLLRLRDRGVANTGGFTGTQRLSLIMENAGGGSFPFQLFSETGALRIGYSSVATPTAKVEIKGSGSTSATTSLLVQNSSAATSMAILDDGKVGIGTSAPSYKLDIKDATNSQARFYGFQDGVATDDSGEIILGSNGSLQGILKYKGAGGQLIFQNTYANNNSQLNLRVINTATTVIDALTVIGSGNVGINQTAPTARLHVKGSGSTSATTSLLVQDSAGNAALTVTDNLVVTFGNYIAFTNGDFIVPSNSSGALELRPTASSGKVLLKGATAINNTSAMPVASAILDLTTTTQGFLPPRMTTAQKNAIATPAAGLMVYDSTLAKLCVYTTAWETITSV